MIKVEEAKLRALAQLAAVHLNELADRPDRQFLMVHASDLLAIIRELNFLRDCKERITLCVQMILNQEKG